MINRYLFSSHLTIMQKSRKAEMICDNLFEINIIIIIRLGVGLKAGEDICAK